MPKPLAMPIIAEPIPPTPTRPSVRPYSPFAFEYSALFQRPSRRSSALCTIRRSSARISPNASSATAIAVLAGAVGHVDPAAGGLGDVDRVVAGAGAHDERERTGGEHVGRHLGAADDEHLGLQ